MLRVGKLLLHLLNKTAGSFKKKMQDLLLELLYLLLQLQFLLHYLLHLKRNKMVMIQILIYTIHIMWT